MSTAILYLVVCVCETFMNNVGMCGKVCIASWANFFFFFLLLFVCEEWINIAPREAVLMLRKYWSNNRTKLANGNICTYYTFSGEFAYSFRVRLKSVSFLLRHYEAMCKLFCWWLLSSCYYGLPRKKVMPRLRGEQMWMRKSRYRPTHPPSNPSHPGWDPKGVSYTGCLFFNPKYWVEYIMELFGCSPTSLVSAFLAVSPNVIFCVWLGLGYQLTN